MRYNIVICRTLDPTPFLILDKNNIAGRVANQENGPSGNMRISYFNIQIPGIFAGLLYCLWIQSGASSVDHFCYFCLVFVMLSCASVCHLLGKG